VEPFTSTCTAAKLGENLFTSDIVCQSQCTSIVFLPFQTPTSSPLSKMESHTSLPRRRTLSITRRGHHRNGSSANEQTKAHVPTLKGLGKSDCEVKIVSILECESLIPVGALFDHSSCMLYLQFGSETPLSH
jgi:hypothetical protein